MSGTDPGPFGIAAHATDPGEPIASAATSDLGESTDPGPPESEGDDRSLADEILDAPADRVRVQTVHRRDSAGLGAVEYVGPVHEPARTKAPALTVPDALVLLAITVPPSELEAGAAPQPAPARTGLRDAPTDPGPGEPVTTYVARHPATWIAIAAAAVVFSGAIVALGRFVLASDVRLAPSVPVKARAAPAEFADVALPIASAPLIRPAPPSPTKNPKAATPGSVTPNPTASAPPPADSSYGLRFGKFLQEDKNK